MNTLSTAQHIDAIITGEAAIGTLIGAILDTSGSANPSATPSPIAIPESSNVTANCVAMPKTVASAPFRTTVTIMAARTPGTAKKRAYAYVIEKICGQQLREATHKNNITSVHTHRQSNESNRQTDVLE